MKVRFLKVGKAGGLLLIVLCVFLSSMNFSSCQQSCYQFTAYIQVDRGCGSSYSHGDPITVYFMIEAILISSGESGSSSGMQEPVLNQAAEECPMSLPKNPPPSSPTSPAPDYSSNALVSIVDHLPNSAGSKYLVKERTCTINTICLFCGTVDCDSGSGTETVELIAEIYTTSGIISLRSFCSFYVDCALPQSLPSNPAPVCYDYDADGYTNCDGDCNDFDNTVYPGAEDLCDEIDNDCDGQIDEDCLDSSITLEVSPESINIDDAVYLSGVLSPSRVADIHLIFTKPDNTMFTTVVNSNEEGAYSFSFVPDSLGMWSVSATGKGDVKYRTATSDKVFFSVKKIKTSLSLRVNSVLLYPSEEIRISGAILPAMIANITLTIEDGNGNKEKKVVSTLADGTFSLSHTTDSVGTWSVSAQFGGSGNHESSSSSTVHFTVTREESALSLSISFENEKTIEGDTIEIIGQIRPQRATTILIYLENREEEPSFQVQSNADGTFSKFFTPKSAGIWLVYARVPEEAKYTSAQSNTLSFSVEPAIPDLALFNPVIDSPSVEPGEQVEIHFEVENLGTGAAKDIVIYVIARSETNEKVIHEEKVAEIGAGSQRIIHLEWPADPGVDTLFIEIDPSNQIQELREDNNDAAQQMDISFKRDISVTGIHFSPEKAREGEAVKITAEIHYEGELPQICEIEFWDGNPEKGSRIGPPIEFDLSNSSAEIRWEPEPGNHEIYVVVDSSKEVNEFDEDNNIMMNGITVEETPLPIAEAVITVAAGISGGIYWYLKHVKRSLYRTGKQISQKVHEIPRGPGESLGQGAKIPPGVQPAEHVPSYIAKNLLKAGGTTAASEIGAKLYRALYSRYYHQGESQPADFERAVQSRLNLLEKVIDYLLVSGGYIDIEEFCQEFYVDKPKLLEILDFLSWNGYIQEVVS